MSQPEQINVFDNIQAICRDYRRHLKRGEVKPMERFLDLVDEETRQILFQNLLDIDIGFRRRNGESPSSDEYVSRFPSFTPLIRQAFFESTMMSQDFVDGDTPDSDQATVTIGMLAARKLGQYELLRELGRGGFGVVYEARHLQRGDHVAIKTLPALVDGQVESARDAERLHRFRIEFRSLSEINHPNLAGMQSLEVDGNQWFFTMDLVKGVDFLSYVRPSGNLDEDRLRSALKQLARGIIALHDRGIVHRDLKPSNVLVGADGHVVILDFGLVAELQNLAGETLSIGTKHFAGTPRYAAPEQASGERSAAVDWYAMGVMIYEAITGDAPFTGSGVDLLIAKQTSDAPRLCDDPSTPDDLAKLVDSLLRRQPDERASGEQVAESLGLATESTLQESTTASRGDSSGEESAASPNEELLIGRETQLAELRACHESFSNDQKAHAVFVAGRSGEGKTSLVERFLADRRRSGGTLILTGRCYDRESVPFKAIDCWIDALVTHLRRMPPESVAEMLPRDIGMLTRLFPVLRRVSTIDASAGTSLGNIDSRQARYRGFAALRDLLSSIAQRIPIVLFIDDVQWADADSAGALHETLSHVDAPHLMLVCSYRSDEAGESPFLGQWKQQQSDTESAINESLVRVAPLTKAECLELASARLNLPIESLEEKLGEFHDGTQGNPYFVEQLLEGFDAKSGEFSVVPFERLLSDRMTRLPPAASPLLETIAIAGQAAKLAEVGALCDGASNVFSVVTHMRSERLVRLIGSGDEQYVDTYHDKIRETVLQGLDPNHRRDLHLKFARWLEQQEQISLDTVRDCLCKNANSARNQGIEGDRLFDISHHYLEAGHPNAFAYQLMAGVTSLVSYAGEEALAFLQRAADIMPEQTDAMHRYTLWLSMGKACLILKQPQRAGEYFGHANNVATTDLQRALVQMGLATAERFDGKFDKAIAHYDSALQLIGMPRPRTRLGALVSILRDTLPVLWAGSPRKFKDPSEVQETDSSVVQYTTLRELGGLLLEKDMLAFLACAAKACRQSVREGTAESMVAGYEWAAGFFGAAALLPIAKTYHRRADKIESAMNDPQITEQRSVYVFAYDYWIGDLAAAERVFHRSWEAINRIGEHNEAMYRPHMLRHVATFLHPTSVELKWAETVLQAAKELGSEQQQCWGVYDVGVAQARRGNLVAAMQRLEESMQLLGGEPHYMTESIRGASLGFVCLQCSEYDRACKFAGEAWSNAVRHLVLLDVAAFALPVYMESLTGPRWIDGIGRDEQRKLKRLVWWTRALFHTLPNHQPHLLRVLGRYEAGRGRSRKAVKHFRRSMKLAQEKKMDYALARAMLDLTPIASDESESLRSQATELLKKTEAVIPHAEQWLLGDEFDPDVVASPS